jgi:hypothetical protein
MKSMDQEQLEEKKDEVVAEMPAENKSKKLFIKGLASSVGVIAGVVIVAGVVVGYRSPDTMPFATRCLAAIHAPAAMVGGSIIGWNDIKTDSDALGLYLSNSGAPATEYTGDVFRTRVLHRQMLTLAAEKMAKDLGIVVSDEQLNKELEDISAASGGKDKVEADIKKNFGWTLDQYRDRVVRSMLVLQELQKKLLADDKFVAPAKEKAEAALAEVKSGKDFAAVAKEVSQDSSAAVGGDLGFMKPGQTVPEFDSALFAMKRGEVSGLVKTEFGYHIIKVEEIKKDRAGKTTEVHARHILIKFPSVVLEIQKWLDEASIYQFMHTTVPGRVDTAAEAGQK